MFLLRFSFGFLFVCLFFIKHFTGCCRLLVRFQVSENADPDSFCQDFVAFMEGWISEFPTALFSLTYSKQNPYTFLNKLKISVS